jgi:hypothetical protein
MASAVLKTIMDFWIEFFATHRIVDDPGKAQE